MFTKVAASLVLTAGALLAAGAAGSNKPACCVDNAACCKTGETCCVLGSKIADPNPAATEQVALNTAVSMPICCIKNAYCCSEKRECCPHTASLN